MNIKPTKYDINQQVYVNTKNGLEFRQIEEIRIIVTKETIVVFYQVKGIYDYYTEQQIIPNKVAAKKQLTNSLNQIQLAIG